MKQRLWNDVKNMVERRIRKGAKQAETKAQKRKFWLVQVTDAFIRVERERSKFPHEDIPKADFIEIWEDLNEGKYASVGYKQHDLQEGQNRHSAISFALVAMLPYVRWKRVGRAWTLCLADRSQNVEAT